MRRLGPHLAALALEALEHRGLLAADVGAGADAHADVEGEPAARGRRSPSQPRAAGGVDGAPRMAATASGYSERR